MRTKPVSSSGGKRIVWTSDTLSPRLQSLPQKVDAAVSVAMQYKAPQVQNHMRDNAPWTDRTSNARNGLFAKYVKASNGKSHAIVIYHTMPYGLWLEVRWSGKYAIINPTLQRQGPEVMRFLNNVLARMN